MAKRLGINGFGRMGRLGFEQAESSLFVLTTGILSMWLPSAATLNQGDNDELHSQ